MGDSINQLSMVCLSLAGYMNLPRSAVTPTMPKAGCSQEYSDYMNVEPRDIHIYQNTSVLSINTSGDRSAVSSINPADVGLTLTSPHTDPLSATHTAVTNQNSSQTTAPASESTSLGLSAVKDFSTEVDTSNASASSGGAPQSHSSNQSNNTAPGSVLGDSRSPDSSASAPSDLMNPIASTSISSASSAGKSSRTSQPETSSLSMSPGRRREGMADSSFVEKKYGLAFGDLPSETKHCPSGITSDSAKSKFSQSQSRMRTRRQN